MQDGNPIGTQRVNESEREFLPSATLETLRLRAGLLFHLRQFFHSRGYWEVETPILSHETIVDAHLEPFVTSWSADEGAGPPHTAESYRLYLQTSPELGMKRVLAAGAQAVYQFTRALRNGEYGRFHNPEFTMLEWYRVGDSHQEQMDFVQELVVDAALSLPALVQACGASLASRDQGVAGLVQKPFERLSFDDAFERHAGHKVLQLSPDELARVADQHGIVPPPGLATDDRDAWLNLLLVQLVEPHLGHNHPVFLYDFPHTQAALAKVRAGAPSVAERFELYLRGVEICNGYHELIDADELGRRVEQQAALREGQGRPALPQPRQLLAALRWGLPDCAGVALGFDRLLMLLLGTDSLRDVMAFPWDRA